MEYQEIITAYKKDELNIDSLKERLEKAKTLKGREKYRALGMASKSISFSLNAANITSMPEEAEKTSFFEAELNSILGEYFSELVNYINTSLAWKFIDLLPEDYTREKFDALSIEEKFGIVSELNRKYAEFLEFQKLADIRDCFKGTTKLSLDDIKQIAFLRLMFNSIENEFIKKEFYCFEPKFLRALVDFKKSKVKRIEDYMNAKTKSVRLEYEKNRKFFTTEDYRDIAENLVQTSKTLKRSITSVIEYFSEISESEAEEEYLRLEAQTFKELEEKYLKMKAVKESAQKEKSEKKKKDKKEEDRKKRAEEKRLKEQEERRKRQKEKDAAEEAESDRVIAEGEGSTVKMKEKIEELKQTPMAKEIVIPLIFSWLEREDVSLTSRIGGSKRLSEFFELIKSIERTQKSRISLFLVTNAGKEITLKRVRSFQDEAKKHGLTRLVEGALGGYSAFKIDASGKIVDMAKMSNENRQKIINLVEKTREFYMPKDMIDQSETNYLRYEFSKNDDSSITKQYLGMMINRLVADEKVKKQPLKFVPYIERNSTGIDVLLESQVRGISQIADYYRAKYEIAPTKTLKADINSVDKFISSMKVGQEK